MMEAIDRHGLRPWPENAERAYRDWPDSVHEQQSSARNPIGPLSMVGIRGTSPLKDIGPAMEAMIGQAVEKMNQLGNLHRWRNDLSLPQL